MVFVKILKGLAHLGLFVLGIRVSPNLEALQPGQSKIFICNHVSAFDAIWMFAKFGVSLSAKAELFDSFLFGPILRATQGVPVYRNKPAAHFRKELEYRVTNGFPPILLFPEGTTTSRDHVLGFRLGGFSPSLSVTPVVIKFDKFDPYEGVAGSSLGTFFVAWAICCQISYPVEYTVLPEMSPTDSEANSLTHTNSQPPLSEHDMLKQFVDRVRSAMADACLLKKSAFTVNDFFVRSKAGKLKIGFSNVLVENVKVAGGFQSKEITELLDVFNSIRCSGHQELCFGQLLTQSSLADPFKDSFLFRVFSAFASPTFGTVDFLGFLSVLSVFDTQKSAKNFKKLVYLALYDHDGRRAQDTVLASELKEMSDFVSKLNKPLRATSWFRRVDWSKKVATVSEENQKNEKMSVCQKDGFHELMPILAESKDLKSLAHVFDGSLPVSVNSFEEFEQSCGLF